MSGSNPKLNFAALAEPNEREKATVNNKLPVLLLTQVLPFPPDAGPKIKTFNLIKYLSNSFSITLVSFVRPDNTSEHKKELLKYCSEVYTIPMARGYFRDVTALVKSLFTGQPFLIVRDQRFAMQDLLKQLTGTKKFAVVHADQLNMAQYALPLPVAARLLDQHNAVWTITDRLQHSQKNPLKKLLLALETIKLRQYERKVCRQFDIVLAVSRQDEAALGLPCEIIPIGVDAAGIEPLRPNPASLNLVSLGTMFYPPNVEATLWFGQQVFPLIQKQQPNATYTIIGAKPPAEIYNLAEHNPAIKVLGYVEELRPVLADSAGLVVPLLSGGGMRVKILDALALGLPIVSTTVGAEGVELEHNKTALLADSPEDFARVCLQLLDSLELRKSLSQAGRYLALDKYDFRRAYSPLDRVYNSMLEKHKK